jgi:hypothetical protein
MSANGSEARERNGSANAGSAPAEGPVRVQELDGREQVRESSPADPIQDVEQLISLAIGLVSLAVGAVVERVAPASTAEPEARREPGSPPEGPGRLVARGVRVSGRAAIAAVRRTAGVTSATAGRILRATGGRHLQDPMAAMATRVRAARSSSEAAAGAFLDSVVPDLVTAIADRVDLTELVLDRMDLDRIVASLDLRALASRLPVDVIVDRLDVDAVAGRLDLDAVIRRLDLSGIAVQVIHDIDLPEVIRESTGDLGTEAVDTIRFKSMNADRRLSRWRDRLGSHDGRGASTPSSGGRAP